MGELGGVPVSNERTKAVRVAAAISAPLVVGFDDGLTDMVLKFEIPELDLAVGDTEAELTGRTFGGMPIEGTGAVEVEERMCLRTLE